MRCPVCTAYVNACRCDPVEKHRAIRKSFDDFAKWKRQGQQHEPKRSAQ